MIPFSKPWRWLTAAALLWSLPAVADPEPAPLPPARGPVAAEPAVSGGLNAAEPPPPAPVAKPVLPAAPEPGRPGDPVAATQNNVHGIGVAGSFATGTGLTYRRYFGNTSIQASCLAVITQRGQDALAFVGASVVQYLLVWHSPNSRGLLPSSTALRVTGGAHYYLRKSVETTFEFSQGISTPITKFHREASINFGAGIGAEFGGIVTSGFSLSLDLLLTAAFDSKGLDYILPLPQSSLVYSW